MNPEKKKQYLQSIDEQQKEAVKYQQQLTQEKAEARFDPADKLDRIHLPQICSANKIPAAYKNLQDLLNSFSHQTVIGHGTELGLTRFINDEPDVTGRFIIYDPKSCLGMVHVNGSQCAFPHIEGMPPLLSTESGLGRLVVKKPLSYGKYTDPDNPGVIILICNPE